jgi:ABC-type dipeptide/oligopeptide/nickel transport system permease subunit
MTDTTGYYGGWTDDVISGLALNLLGDGLRDVLDPRLKQ